VPGRRRANQLRTDGSTTISGIDKAKNAVEHAAGKAKEGIGKVSGDRDTDAEGKTEQAKADLKNAGEDVKDAFRH
jgi:uncharacterized protein YjbJ (UPF0337 family)